MITQAAAFRNVVAASRKIEDNLMSIQAIQTCPNQFWLCVSIRGRRFYTICSPESLWAWWRCHWRWLRHCLRGHAAGGLYTAVVAGFLISALGGSRTQIGGPTGAFVVIVAGIVARFGISGLAMVHSWRRHPAGDGVDRSRARRCDSFRGPLSSDSPTASQC